MSVKIKGIILLLFVSLSSFMSLHKYYVSVTDIEYVKADKSVQIISRLFIDDFEGALKERYDDSLKLDDKKASFYIEKYFSKKLEISIDDSKMPLNFIGSELEDDMIHCYFEIDDVSEFKKIKVKNALLFDRCNNQQNITHLTIDSKKKSFLLIKDNDSGLLKL